MCTVKRHEDHTGNRPRTRAQDCALQAAAGSLAAVGLHVVEASGAVVPSNLSIRYQVPSVPLNCTRRLSRESTGSTVACAPTVHGLHSVLLTSQVLVQVRTRHHPLRATTGAPSPVRLLTQAWAYPKGTAGLRAFHLHVRSHDAWAMTPVPTEHDLSTTSQYPTHHFKQPTPCNALHQTTGNHQSSLLTKEGVITVRHSQHRLQLAPTNRTPQASRTRPQPHTDGVGEASGSAAALHTGVGAVG